MGGSNRAPRTLAFLALAATAAACSKDESGVRPCARLSVVLLGAPPDRFEVVADPGGDGWRSVDCSPGGTRPSDARCAAALAVVPLQPAAAAIGLTIKAPGYR